MIAAIAYAANRPWNGNWFCVAKYRGTPKTGYGVGWADRFTTPMKEPLNAAKYETSADAGAARKSA